jgi:hypothetical protein
MELSLALFAELLRDVTERQKCEGGDGKEGTTDE